jgi:hypothetical protein
LNGRPPVAIGEHPAGLFLGDGWSNSDDAHGDAGTGGEKERGNAMTNEPLVERNRQLERSVKRWRLISLVLALLLIGAVAVGGIFAVIPATHEPGNFWHFLPWVRAREAEMRVMDAEMRARALDAERRAVEAAKERAKDEANPP